MIQKTHLCDYCKKKDTCEDNPANVGRPRIVVECANFEENCGGCLEMTWRRESILAFCPTHISSPWGVVSTSIGQSLPQRRKDEVEKPAGVRKPR